MKLTLTALLLFLSGDALSTTYYALGSENETLGRGFSTSLSMPLSNCLTGDKVFHGGNKGELIYHQSMDSNELMSSMTGSVKGSVNLVLFGGSAKFSMRKKVTENTNSVSSVLQLGYVSGTHSFENRQLNELAKSELQSQPGAIENICGDGFISSITTGSNLYVTAKLYFRDKTEYEWFQTKIKIRVLFFSKTITKTKEFSNAIKNAVYSVQVHTDGGLTPYLNTLGTERFCRGTDVTACMDYADTLFKYLLDGGDYRNDIQPEQLKTIKYTVEPYENSGHMQLIPPSSSNMPAAYIAISGRLRGYQDLVNDELERLGAFIAVATEGELPGLQNEYDLRQTEISTLNAASDYCAGLPGVSLCEQQVESAISEVH